MFALGLLAAPAQAARFCEGTINWALPYDNGDVLIQPSWRNTTEDGLKICNLNTSWNNISPDVCHAWLSVALTAVTTRGPTMVAYAGTTECAAMPLYGNAPAPIYVPLK